jgi:hypothetical protein
MAKKKDKIIQLPLSPENYIRNRVRNIPIGNCYINKEWDEAGMANIIITREHTNGNKTVGLYLVDIFCLGVKDTHYLFNIPDSELEEIIEQIDGSGDSEMIKEKYSLLHNIIYGGIEYAKEFGFKTHKDFNLTKYILEEDDDHIEFIDVEFGLDGKPAVFMGKEQHPSNIISQLERIVGKDNFTIMYEDEDPDDEIDEENDENYIDKPISEWTEHDLDDIMKGNKNADITQTLQLILGIYLSSLNKKEIKIIERKSEEYLNWNIVYNDEAQQKPFATKAEEEEFNLLYDKCDIPYYNALPDIELAIKKYPQSYNFWNLKGDCLLKMGAHSELYEFSIEMYFKFPNEVIAFCNYLNMLKNTDRKEEANKRISTKGGLPVLFPSRKEFTIYEFVSFMKYLTDYYIWQNDIPMTIACTLSLYEFEFDENEKFIAEYIFMNVIETLMHLLQNKHNLNPEDFKL